MPAGGGERSSARPPPPPPPPKLFPSITKVSDQVAQTAFSSPNIVTQCYKFSPKHFAPLSACMSGVGYVNG